MCEQWFWMVLGLYWNVVFVTVSGGWWWCLDGCWIVLLKVWHVWRTFCFVVPFDIVDHSLVNAFGRVSHCYWWHRGIGLIIRRFPVACYTLCPTTISILEEFFSFVAWRFIALCLARQSGSVDCVYCALSHQVNIDQDSSGNCVYGSADVCCRWFLHVAIRDVDTHHEIGLLLTV